MVNLERAAERLNSLSAYRALKPRNLALQKRRRYRSSRLQEIKVRSKVSHDMAEPSEERTFKSYTPVLAKAYATSRGSYHENLFKIILDTHRSTGGAMKVLLDVGCGPGNSTRPLAKHFGSAFGIDPSPEMINTAKSISIENPEETSTGESITFCVGRAEDMKVSFRKPGQEVDLLTSGTAVRIEFEGKCNRFDID